ncbi:TIGR03943 family protein [Actinomadura barringtoniae]|uniref:TIGR03943 family protein n=1 Tax=Actinomadura barringtoniae TaxID=1427535 RepID=A0A939PFI6_9ACTN|nr:TIGR03943 family protein [Actinomadura barringtoniae]MBO2451277.1 TIGR03943 family protein [Actinomadura barringtoniae]
MNRQAQAVLLFLVGGVLLRAASSGLYLRYVKPGLQPLLVAAGVVLIVAALVTVWYETRALWQARKAGHEHGHGHREPRISWLLTLPLLAIILVAPPALGSYSANRVGTALQPPPGFPPLPSGDPLKMTVNDYAGRAAYDHGQSLGTRRIELTGFVSRDPSGGAYLVRMMLNCCAADALPVKVRLTGQVPPVLQPDTWLDVIGTFTPGQTRDPANNGVIPFINVTQARPISAPKDPYED